MPLERAARLRRSLHAATTRRNGSGASPCRKSGDVAIIVYTSGTTGPSKGAMLTHRNIIFQGGAFKRIDLAISETDEALSFLPLCHVAERFGGCYNHIASMHVVNFAEAPDTVPQNLREVAPHIFLAVPRVWEKLYSGITIALKEGTALRPARLPGRDRRSARKASAYELRGQAGAGAAACSACRRRLAGAEEHPHRPGPRPHPLCRYRRGADLARPHALVLGAGRADVRGLRPDRERRRSPPPTTPGRIKLGTIGRRRRCTEVKLSPQGEILLRGPHVFMGYLNKPEKTAEALTRRLAAHRRRRRRSTTRATCASPTA